MRTIPHGVMHQQWADSSVTDAESLAQTVTDVQLAENLGYSSFMFGEHHFPAGKSFPGRIPFPEHVIAHLAAVTERIRLGTGVKVLALDKPWRTVESMLTLDLLAGGRAFFGFGAGGDEPDVFLPERLGSLERRALFRDTLFELLELLRTQGTSAFPAPLGPLDVDSAGLVEKVSVAARDEPTIRFAGHHGLNFVMGQSEVDAVQGSYVRTFREAGGTGEARGVRIVVLAESTTAALEAARPAYETYAAKGFLSSRYYLEAVEAGVFDGAVPRDLADGMHRMAFVVGDPDTVRNRLQEHVDRTAVDRLDIMVHLPGLAPAHVRRSLDLFAREVAPGLTLPPARPADGRTPVPRPVHETGAAR